MVATTALSPVKRKHATDMRAKRHILTVTLEDCFHAESFRNVVHRDRWDRMESRLEANTLETLNLLDRFGIRASFVVLGWVADRQQEIVREVAQRGHEVLSAGYYNRGIREMTPAEFRRDLARARDAIERATHQQVLGYRVAQKWFRSEDLWALDILAEEGYAYDSSLLPIFRSFRSEPWRYTLHQHSYKNKNIWEFPVSTVSMAGLRAPISGGNYFRQFPHTWMRSCVARWDRNTDAPFVMYFHVWELDRQHAALSAGPLARLRVYRNLGERQETILGDYFERYCFVGMADYLGLRTNNPSQPPTSLVGTPSRPRRRDGVLEISTRSVAVTVVIPCFNEKHSLTYLINTLDSVAASIPEYRFRYILVDDASVDGTWERMGQLAGARSDYTLVRHETNQGPAAAILTGIRHAATEIVCSMDCDCSYDPKDLRNMIPHLTEGVDMVTASPYHPSGRVLHVPGWRLGLSKSLSLLYRLLLRQKLATYTSCFRVYRRSAMTGLHLWNGGFLGVAETLARLDMKGARIVEHPATLEARIYGRSKMKVLRTIAGHLGLLARLAVLRLLGGSTS